MPENVNSESFCRALLQRLITDDIAILEGGREYRFSENFSNPDSSLYAGSKYFVYDANGDNILEIGIRLYSGRSYVFQYDTVNDRLKEVISPGIYTEILGGGRLFLNSETAFGAHYFFQIINTDWEEVLSIDFTINAPYIKQLPDGSEQLIEGETYDINGVRVTEEQWKALSKDLWDMLDNAPKPLSYEELMDGG